MTGSSRKSGKNKPVLLVQHAPHEHPAAVRRALESQSISTLWLHPYRGESFPRVTEIAGMISLGGPMSANDEAEHPWITREMDLLRACVERDLPTVGICLGGQMMARALGGRVEKNDQVEVGWFPIQVTPAGAKDPIIGSAGASPTVYHWHGDTFHLPVGAELLATSKACPRQAYRVSEKVYGFQFHPEADHQLVLEWLSIEGVDQEIEEIRKHHGKRTVQDAKTQGNVALKGEKGSLRITAAIGTLFRTRPTLGVNHAWREFMGMLVTHRTTVVLEFEGTQGRLVHLRGRVTAVLTIASGEFIILQEENTLLWPIRMEDIRKIAPVN